MKKQVHFRINETIDSLLRTWKEKPETRLALEGKPVSIAKQIERSASHLVRSFIQRSISEADIADMAALNGESVGFYRVHIPMKLHSLINGVTDGTKIGVSQVVRASIVWLPTLLDRYKLEQEYLSKGGIGCPELMSDDMLILWNKYRNEGPVSDGVRIVRALRDLNVKYQATTNEVEKLSALFEKYAISGILNSENVPHKKEILALSGKPLRAMCKRWKLRASDQAPDGVLRRQLLSHFGYHQPQEV